MEKSYIEYKGKSYPTIEIALDKVSDIDSSHIVILADTSLWDAIEEDYNNKINDAIDIDNDVYYYMDYGFINDNVTEKDVIEYMKKYN
jgi:hypothetical protein